MRMSKENEHVLGTNSRSRYNYKRHHNGIVNIADLQTPHKLSFVAALFCHTPAVPPYIKPMLHCY